MSETFWLVMNLITALALILVFIWGCERNEASKFYRSDAEWWRNRHDKIAEMHEDTNRRLREAEHRITKAQRVLAGGKS